jgi:hypothetical protein
VRAIAGVEVEAVGASCFDVEPELVAAGIVSAAGTAGARAATPVEKEPEATGGLD